MTYETIECLQDNGLEVIVDLEHAMDAACGRRENGNDCDPDFSQHSLDYFHQIVAQCAGQQVSRIVVCDTTGGANPTRSAKSSKALCGVTPAPASAFTATPIAASESPMPAPRSLPEPLRSKAPSRHRRTLRQREPDHRHRQHATERRSRVCNSRVTCWTDKSGSLGLLGLRSRTAARHAHRRPRRIRHMGRHARQQRTQKPRRLSLVRSRACRRQSQSSASTANRAAPTSSCSLRPWAFRSTPRRRRP